MSDRVRLPYEPVAVRLVHVEGVPFTAEEVAVVLDCTVDRVKRMKAKGLDVWQADRVACRMGVMPWDIWDDPTVGWAALADAKCGVAA